MYTVDGLDALAQMDLAVVAAAREAVQALLTAAARTDVDHIRPDIVSECLRCSRMCPGEAVRVVCLASTIPPRKHAQFSRSSSSPSSGAASKKAVNGTRLSTSKASVAVRALRVLAQGGPHLRAYVSRVVSAFVRVAAEENQCLAFRKRSDSPLVSELSKLYRELLQIHRVNSEESAVSRALDAIHSQFPSVAESTNGNAGTPLGLVAFSSSGSFVTAETRKVARVHECEQALTSAESLLKEIRELFGVAGQQGLLEIAHGVADGLRDALRDIWARLVRVEKQLACLKAAEYLNTFSTAELEMLQKLQEMLQRIDSERSFCRDVNVSVPASMYWGNGDETREKSFCDDEEAQQKEYQADDIDSDFDEEWEDPVLVSSELQLNVLEQPEGVQSTGPVSLEGAGLPKSGQASAYKSCDRAPLSAAEIARVARSRDAGSAMNSTILQQLGGHVSHQGKNARASPKFPPVRTRLKARLKQAKRSRSRQHFGKLP